MRIEAESVDDYVRQVPEHRQEAVRLVCERVRRRTPGVEETLDHHMPFYRLDGDSYIAVASQKHHVSLYLVMLDETLDEEGDLADELADIDRGKNCLRFRDSQLDRLTVDLVDRIVDATRVRAQRRSPRSQDA